jgi:hypothetical protein
MKTVIDNLNAAIIMLEGMAEGGRDENGLAAAALDMVKEAIAELETPHYYTPEQWEAETGEVLRDEAILWSRGNCGWGLVKWKHLKDLTGIKKFVMVVVDGPYPPPDNWRPEEK